MKAGYPIRIVKGNYFAIAQPLEKITWEGVTRQKVDYVPDDGDKISVCLVGKYSRHDIVNVSIEGNLLKWDCNGEINTGSYGVEVTVACADGRNLRSYQRDRIQIVNSNEEAGITTGDEFDVDTYEISGAVLLYVKGDKGEPGKDGSMHFEDLTPAQKEELKGDKGDTGIGIASIVQTQTATESDGENEIEVTMDDDAENPTKYQFIVRNGKRGEEGLSAYEVYLSTVPEGEEAMRENEWLASLIGKSAYQVYYDAAVAQGLTPMSENEWIASLKGDKGDDGKSAYDIAVEQGYEDSKEAWIASLKGNKGDDGDSAYQTYLNTLEEGETALTPEQWIASLKGQQGEQGPKGDTVIMDGQRSYTLYDVPGDNTDGAMTQAAVTALFAPVTSEQVSEMEDPS